MRPSDRIKKSTLKVTEGYRLIGMSPLLDRRDLKVGSYVKIKNIDDDGGEVWIPLSASENWKSNGKFNKKKWSVAIYHLNFGGYHSAFGLLVPNSKPGFTGYLTGVANRVSRQTIKDPGTSNIKFSFDQAIYTIFPVKRLINLLIPGG